MKFFLSFILMFFTFTTSSFAWSAWDFPETAKEEIFGAPLKFYYAPYSVTCKKHNNSNKYYYKTLSFEMCQDQILSIVSELNFFRKEYKHCKNTSNRYEHWCTKAHLKIKEYERLLGRN